MLGHLGHLLSGYETSCLEMEAYHKVEAVLGAFPLPPHTFSLTTYFVGQAHLMRSLGERRVGIIQPAQLETVSSSSFRNYLNFFTLAVGAEGI